QSSFILILISSELGMPGRRRAAPFARALVDGFDSRAGNTAGAVALNRVNQLRYRRRLNANVIVDPHHQFSVMIKRVLRSQIDRTAPPQISVAVEDFNLGKF